MEGIIIKKSTMETLKKDGYTDKQIKALASLATFKKHPNIARSEYTKSFAGGKFPSGGYAICYIENSRYFDDWNNSSVRYVYPNRRTLSSTLASICKKAIADKCPYLGFGDRLNEKTWYMDWDMFVNDLPYSDDIYVEIA